MTRPFLIHSTALLCFLFSAPGRAFSPNLDSPENSYICRMSAVIPEYQFPQQIQNAGSGSFLLRFKKSETKFDTVEVATLDQSAHFEFSKMLTKVFWGPKDISNPRGPDWPRLAEQNIQFDISLIDKPEPQKIFPFIPQNQRIIRFVLRSSEMPLMPKLGPPLDNSLDSLNGFFEYQVSTLTGEASSLNDFWAQQWKVSCSQL